MQADFVAAVSHEFRTPLTSLAHVSEMLAEGRLADDELRGRSYDVLVRDTDRLRRLVETLLDFGHFERGGAVRMERTDVRAFVREVLSEFAQRMESSGYIVDVTTPDDAVFVQLDRDAMRRALWNLLDNAVKYSPDDRIVSVTLTARSAVCIIVRDEGLGIPAHEQRAIFDKFFRGTESKARRIRGTGLGLALVRQIVGAHGGDVQVRSAVGQGSSFTITLPLAVVDGAAGECTEGSPFVPAGQPAFAKATTSRRAASREGVNVGQSPTRS
jgi:signal transduction histidine kinase